MCFVDDCHISPSLEPTRVHKTGTISYSEKNTKTKRTDRKSCRYAHITTPVNPYTFSTRLAHRCFPDEKKTATKNRGPSGTNSSSTSGRRKLWQRSPAISKPSRYCYDTTNRFSTDWPPLLQSPMRLPTRGTFISYGIFYFGGGREREGEREGRKEDG